MRCSTAFAVALAGLALPACTILAGVEGLSGGAGDGGSGDSGAVVAPSAHDAAAADGQPALDAPSDGGAADHPSASDAPPDRAPDAPAQSYCMTQTPTPELCEDFDHGPFGQQFSNVITSAAATLGPDTTASITPPNSLLATVAANDAGTGGDYSYVTRLFVGTASTHITMAFDMRVDSWVTGGHSVIPAGMHIDDGAPDAHRLTLYLQDGTAGIEESFQGEAGSVYLDHTLSMHPQLGVWTRVSFTLDLAGRTCSATLDGQTALAPTTIDPSWQAGPPSIDVGMTYIENESTEWAIRYDNVIVYWN